jgi:hypothetical protein
MTTQTADLFLLEDLEDSRRTSHLAGTDRAALEAVGTWIKSFVIRPHEQLGRAGPVCPFVPGSLERKTFWLAPERVADRGVEHVAELMSGYKNLFLRTEPMTGEGADYKVIVVVFTDLSPDRARGLFDNALEPISVRSYVDDGVIFGPFYDGNEGTAIYNASFRPFQSPVPFVFVRQSVISDWKFFLDKPDWFNHWAQRFGLSAVHALAAELRRLPWRRRDEGGT